MIHLTAKNAKDAKNAEFLKYIFAPGLKSDAPFAVGKSFNRKERKGRRVFKIYLCARAKIRCALCGWKILTATRDYLTMSAALNHILFFLLTIRWQDIADIALNSFILFRLYILFKGTKVFRMLIGIVLLWFCQEIAFSLRFIVTSLVIQGITAVSALIIIVVFSNEIRSVFQAKNLKAILWEFPRKTIQTPVEIIADSIFEMARKYCGALIVFPGKDDLKEIIQNGLPWDGLVSKEMIMSIFWYGNPVHDGAAVIQGDRVTEVGVILPLSKRNLPASYGTRHRAAKGLIEVSDALVVVVSEERGSVLAAKGNRLNVLYDKEELEKELLEHAGVQVRQQGDRKEKLSLCTAGLICMLCVTGIWFGITRGLNTLIALEVPIEYMNRDSAVKIVSATINTVRVHLSGSDILIKSVRPEQVRVKIDLSKAVIGHNSFPIKKEDITLPPGIFLTKIEPDVVEMKIESPVKLEVPITCINLDPALEMINTSAAMAYLHLSGPDDLIKSVRPEECQVKADLSKAVEGINTVPVMKENIVLPPAITLKKLEPDTIEIKVGRLISKELPIQADWTGKLDERFILTEVRISPEKILVKGNPRILENFSTIYTEKIPLDNIEKSGNLTVKLEINGSKIKIAPDFQDKAEVRYVIRERIGGIAGYE